MSTSATATEMAAVTAGDLYTCFETVRNTRKGLRGELTLILEDKWVTIAYMAGRLSIYDQQRTLAWRPFEFSTATCNMLSIIELAEVMIRRDA